MAADPGFGVVQVTVICPPLIDAVALTTGAAGATETRPPSLTGLAVPGCSSSPISVGVAVAQLTIEVEAPAADAAVVEQGARPEHADRDGGRGTTGAEAHDRLRAGGLVVTDRAVEVGVAERPVVVRTPAPDGAVVQHGAGVERAGADRGGGPAGPDVDRAHRTRALVVADHLCRRRVAELAGAVVRAPTAHRAVVEDGAGVVTAGADRRRRAADAEVDRWHRAGRLVVADPGRAVVEERAPAPEAAVVEDGAGGVAVGRDRRGGAAGPDVDWTGGCRGLVIADVLGEPDQGIRVAQHATGVVPPTENGAVVEDRAGVVEAGADRDGRAPRSEIDGAGRRRALGVADVVRVAVPELAVRCRRPNTARCRCRGWRTCGRARLESAVAVRPEPRKTDPTTSGCSSSPTESVFSG